MDDVVVLIPAGKEKQQRNGLGKKLIITRALFYLPSYSLPHIYIFFISHMYVVVVVVVVGASCNLV